MGLEVTLNGKGMQEGGESLDLGRRTIGGIKNKMGGSQYSQNEKELEKGYLGMRA